MTIPDSLKAKLLAVPPEPLSSMDVMELLTTAPTEFLEAIGKAEDPGPSSPPPRTKAEIRATVSTAWGEAVMPRADLTSAPTSGRLYTGVAEVESLGIHQQFQGEDSFDEGQAIKNVLQRVVLFLCEQIGVDAKNFIKDQLTKEQESILKLMAHGGGLPQSKQESIDDLPLLLTPPQIVGKVLEYLSACPPEVAKAILRSAIELAGYMPDATPAGMGFQKAGIEGSASYERLRAIMDFSMQQQQNEGEDVV